MQNYNCLICNGLMVGHHKIAYYDYVCNKQDDHQLSFRIVHNIMNDTRRMQSLRIAFYRERLHLKVYYDDKYSEVWAKVNSANRIKINHIIVPNFSDIEKLKDKIRMLLVFS